MVLRINACIAICCCVVSSPGALGSEVSALAHRAVPATIEYHVIQPTWLHKTILEGGTWVCDELRKYATGMERTGSLGVGLVRDLGMWIESERERVEESGKD